MKSPFWLVVLLVLVALGVAPVAYGVWLAVRLETWTPTHLACAAPALGSALFVIWLRRRRRSGARPMPAIPFVAAALGLVAASLLFAAWAHLSVVSSARVLRFAMKPEPEPASITLPTLGFALIHGYSAWLLVYHAAVLLWNGLTPDPKNDPIRVTGPMQSSFQELFGAQAGAPLQGLEGALSHDACCSFQRTERELLVGVALVGAVEAPHLATLADLARARVRHGDKPWARDLANALAALAWKLDRHEFLHTPFSLWHWIVAAARAPVDEAVAFAATAAERAAVRELRERGSPIDEALRAQVRAAGVFLRRVWSAVAASQRALAQLLPEDPLENLYRLPPAPEYADGPIDVHELSRVTGLSAALVEEIAGGPSDPGGERAASGLGAEILAEHEARFTRRILYHSVIEYRMHALALGDGVDRRTLSHD